MICHDLSTFYVYNSVYNPIVSADQSKPDMIHQLSKSMVNALDKQNITEQTDLATRGTQIA